MDYVIDETELVQKLENVIHNLNAEGLSLMYRLMGNMHEIKKYNINTTPEEVTQIKQQEKEQEALKTAEREERMHKEYMQRMAEKIAKREEEIASLTGKEKRFWDKIEKVKKMNIGRYCMEWWQCELIFRLYNNNYLNASYDEFCYGFHQGMQYMKNQAKKRKVA